MNNRKKDKIYGVLRKQGKKQEKTQTKITKETVTNERKT